MARSRSRDGAATRLETSRRRRAEPKPRRHRDPSRRAQVVAAPRTASKRAEAAAATRLMTSRRHGGAATPPRCRGGSATRLETSRSRGGTATRDEPKPRRCRDPRRAEETVAAPRLETSRSRGAAATRLREPSRSRGGAATRRDPPPARCVAPGDRAVVSPECGVGGAREVVAADEHERGPAPEEDARAVGDERVDEPRWPPLRQLRRVEDERVALGERVREAGEVGLAACGREAGLVTAALWSRAWRLRRGVAVVPSVAASPRRRRGPVLGGFAAASSRAWRLRRGVAVVPSLAATPRCRGPVLGGAAAVSRSSSLRTLLVGTERPTTRGVDARSRPRGPPPSAARSFRYSPPASMPPARRRSTT